MATSTYSQDRSPRAIELGFPILEINRLAQPERGSFKPIYQMHKWFARRASCVFRAILLGALEPAWKADGTPTDLMEEFYRNHYLRELRQEVFPFPPGHRIRVVGFEDVLRAAGDPPREVASFIHETMVAKASELERMGGFVQVVFKSRLHHADDFWFEVGTRRVSLRPIFGRIQHVHQHGNEFFLASFNLS